MFTIAIVAACVIMLLYFSKRPPGPPAHAAPHAAPIFPIPSALSAPHAPAATALATAAIPERAINLLAGKLRKVEDNRILASAIADLTDAQSDPVER